ncbi:MobQ family relaxase [Bacteroides heparinolyticus]|uniref:MobQ family relaxase n=1 Tax=Prevotella heparinolytica TaxID=28113 RepID=UPI0035A17BD6
MYHCTCKIISRGQGRSAVGAAAYRSGEKLYNEYDGIEHDYMKKGSVVYSEIMLCENAPKEYQDRQTLWNAVEQIEKSSKAQLAREYEVALPVELSREEQIKLVRDFAKENFVDNGMCVDFSIHDKEDGNPHAHIMLTTRPIEQDNSWGVKQKKEYILDKNGQKQYDKKKQTYKCKTVKTTNWDSKEFLQRSRESWAEKVNQELEKKSLPQRIDHRSLKEQGVDRVPTIHEGGARKLEKRGIKTDRGKINREIKTANGQMQTIDILTKQTQKEIINIREDIEWNKQHEHIAKIERMLPKATEENKNVLLRLQTEMLKTYNIAKRLEPTTASAERTIECDGRKVPYFDYHKDKLIGDISFIRDKIESSLEAIRERAKTAEPQSGFVVRRESIMRQEQPKQDAQKIDTAYAEEMARKLSALRSEFVKAMVQSAERTSYQPNPIYERQANEIESISKTISEQSRTIKSLQEERDKLGIFKGREKKELQNKIDNFERLRRSNLDKLGALGVSEPSKADEAVKEKRSMAAQEQNRAKAAMQNRGAKERAEEVKAAFLEAAKQIPADQRQEILDRMGQQKEIPTMGRLQYYQAEAEARRQLDTALKQEAQTRERNRTHDRDRGI